MDDDIIDTDISKSDILLSEIMLDGDQYNNKKQASLSINLNMLNDMDSSEKNAMLIEVIEKIQYFFMNKEEAIQQILQWIKYFERGRTK